MRQKLLFSKYFIFLILVLTFFSTQLAFASSTAGYAWSENTGYIDFSQVTVSSSSLSGYAYSPNVGWISMNCDNTSSCGTAEYKVENDSGVLTGYAWSENTGYIDFAGVTISGEEFSGYAYSPNVGWISMNCSNTDSCGTVDYKVTTTWRRSSGTTSGSMPTAINNFKATQQTLATPTVPPISVSCILNFTQILKLTTPLMKNTNVKDLQTCLNTKIPPPLLVTDGVFGPKSKDALMNFQKANNLKVDGIVGPITRGLLTK